MLTWVIVILLERVQHLPLGTDDKDTARLVAVALEVGRGVVALVGVVPAQRGRAQEEARHHLQGLPRASTRIDESGAGWASL